VARVRRSQEERSRAARKKLLDATIAVLVERGYGGLSTKEVAMRAGLSSGALVHHFATKADLVIAATTAVYEESIRRGQKVAMSARAARNPVRGFIEDCASVYFEWPFLAALEVLVAARSDIALLEQILPVMRRYREVTNTIWLDVFRRSGIGEADCDLLLNLSLNMVRGMAVNSLWQKDIKRYRELLDSWESLAYRAFPKLKHTA
jgi:AcrR family transcriptional regulator